MTVSAFNVSDNSPVVLEDAEAAAKYAAGEIGFAPDQEVPIRAPDGRLGWARAADLQTALSAPGYQLDFVGGNQARARALRTEQTQQLIEETAGPATPLVAGATTTANTALLGLPGVALSQEEEERSRSPVLNPTSVAYWQSRGYSHQDALLLADERYARPTYVESVEEANPVASGLGTAAGIILPAGATLGASLAVEAPIAGAVASRLGAAGLGEVAAGVGGRAVASAASAGLQTGLEIGAQRVGQGLIRDEMPQFTGEDLGMLALGTILGGGGSLTADALGAGWRATRRGLGALADLSDSALASHAPNIDLEMPVTHRFDPTGPLGGVTEARVGINEVMNIDPSVNRRFMNPEYIRAAKTPDNIFIRNIDDATEALDSLEAHARHLEETQGLTYRENYGRAAAEHIAQLPAEELPTSFAKLAALADDIVEGRIINGRSIYDGEISPLIREAQAIGAELRKRVPRSLLDEARITASRSLSPEGVTFRNGVSLDDLVDVQTQMRAALTDAAATMPTIQGRMARLMGKVTTPTERIFAGQISDTLARIDEALLDPGLFGPGAAQVSKQTRPFRMLQNARLQAVQDLGTDAVDVANGARSRTFSARRLEEWAQRAKAAATQETDVRVNAFLDSVAAADPTRRAEVEALKQKLRRDVLEVGRARVELAQMSGQRAAGNSNITQTVLAGGAGAAVAGALGPATGALAGGAVLGARMALRPDELVRFKFMMMQLKDKLATRTRTASAAVARRMDNPKLNLELPARAVRNVILPNPALYDPATQEREFDAIVEQVAKFTDSPTMVATRMGEAGFDVNSPSGSAAVTTLTQALQYLRSQMPNTLFETPNPTPPSRRVSSMVRSNVIRTLEGLHDPLSVYEDFGGGFVSRAKVQAVRANFPELTRAMNAQAISDYTDRVAAGVQVSYATRLQLSALVGTPIEAALRQPYLAALQARSAQTPQQAQAQGMGRQPARAVNSITTSTTTEGASLQDNQ